MSAHEPRVTIGVPVYNGARTMRDTVDSLLAQTYENFVLLISGNALEDETPEVCREYQERDSRVQYARQSHKLGVVRNANSLLIRAETDYFMWHAVDDQSEPQMLERCVAALDDQPEAVLACVQAAPIDDEGIVVEHTQRPRNLDSPILAERFEACLDPMDFTENVICGLMRRSAVTRTQLHENFAGGDRALSAELTLYGPSARIGETLFRRRIDGRRKTPEEVSLYNTGRSESISFREWRILRHNLASIARAPIATMEKISALRALWRRLVRLRGIYWAELKTVIRTLMRTLDPPMESAFEGSSA